MSAENTPVFSKEEQAFINGVLAKFPFVSWDRYTYHELSGDRWIMAYGWIQREKDGYKDFLILDLGLVEQEVNSWLTSSARYDDAINKIIGYTDSRGHCERFDKLDWLNPAVVVVPSEASSNPALDWLLQVQAHLENKTEGSIPIKCSIGGQGKCVIYRLVEAIK